MNTTPAEKVRAYARQTTGADKIYPHFLGQIKYASGVRYVAETCGAYWLVDLIASWQIGKRVREEEFQIWELKHFQEETWIVECWTDNPPAGVRIAKQVIHYTTFPPALSHFRLWCEHGTLMLPEER